MFKKLFSNTKSSSVVLFAVVCILLVYVYLHYSQSKRWGSIDSMVNASPIDSSTAVMGQSDSDKAIANTAAPVQGSMSGNVSTNPADLLPSDSNSEWTNLPAGTVGNGIMTPDLMNAGALVGIDTIGQSLRNPNLQLRSDPVISRIETGPWNQSTIEATQSSPNLFDPSASCMYLGPTPK